MECINNELDKMMNEARSLFGDAGANAINLAKDISTEFSNSKNLPGEMKAQVDKEVKSVASMLVGLLQDFELEDDIVKSTNIVEGSTAIERATPIPLHSVAEKANHGTISSSTKMDYPTSYGSIDEKGNWTKTNKTTNQYDFVHSSGTKISIYENGDAVVHTRGNLKHIVEGDYVLEVGNNFDITVGKNHEMYILGDKNMEIDGNNVNQIHKSRITIIDDMESMTVTTAITNESDQVTISGSTKVSITTPETSISDHVTVSGDIATKAVPSYNNHTHPQTDGNHYGGGTNTKTPK